MTVVELRPNEARDPADQINAELAKMKAAGERAMEHALTVGQMLLQTKESLPHGTFGAWIEENVECTWQHANRLMRVAKLNTRVQFDADTSIRVALKQLAPPKAKAKESLRLDLDAAAPHASVRIAELEGEVERLKQQLKRVLTYSTPPDTPIRDSKKGLDHGWPRAHWRQPRFPPPMRRRTVVPRMRCLRENGDEVAWRDG